MAILLQFTTNDPRRSGYAFPINADDTIVTKIIRIFERSNIVFTIERLSSKDIVLQSPYKPDSDEAIETTFALGQACHNIPQPRSKENQF